MRFVCVFEAVYVCVCAGQSKTGSIVKAFETLLNYYLLIVSSTKDNAALAEDAEALGQFRVHLQPKIKDLNGGFS